MYKMKVDLGLDDEQMFALFGKDYIPDNISGPQDAEELDEVNFPEEEKKQ